MLAEQTRAPSRNGGCAARWCDAQLRHALQCEYGLAKRLAVPLSLALQGGGTLGAYTWGVLDRLLQRHAMPLRERASGCVHEYLVAQPAVYLHDDHLPGPDMHVKAATGDK